MNTIFQPTKLTNIRSAVVQLRSVVGEKKKNLESIKAIIEMAALHQPHLVVLPEMCTSGYRINNTLQALEEAEPNTGSSFKFFSQLAIKHRLYIVYGYPEISHNFLYNSQNLVSPSGKLLAVYRKQNLFEMDRNWASPGNLGYVSVKTDVGTIGLGICMDINFDSFLKFHKQNNTQIVAISNCWLKGPEEAIKYWQFRWINFKGLVIISNSYGYSNGSVFAGSSCTIENGKVVNCCAPDKEQIMISDNKIPIYAD